MKPMDMESDGQNTVSKKPKWRKPHECFGLLKEHRRFLAGEPGARPIDLRGQDLRGLDFRRWSLERANLARANLERCNLTGVSFMGANLSGASLHCSRIKGADFSGAILCRAFLAYLDFKDVKLSKADLMGADLSGADLKEAQIDDEDWTTRVAMSRLRIVPDGDVIGWKKLRGGKIAKLLVPAKSKRSNGFNHRCRAEYVQVLSIVDQSDELCAEGVSKRDPNLKYVVGQITKADGWDEGWMNECSHGINFFLTYEEADAY